MLTRIEYSIIKFAFDRILGGRPLFYGTDLYNYVKSECPDVAPGTPCRIIRRLREENRIDYKVLNRNESLYQMRWV